MALLEAKGIHVNFPVGPLWRREVFSALRGIDLSVDTGEIIGIVGESGSGKSTLGNVFVGTQRESLGQLLHKGRPLRDAKFKERAGQFAAVLQHPKWSLNPMLRTGASVIEPLKIIDKAGDAITQRRLVGEALEQVGLPGNFQSRYPHELSGGQRQRVSIARALITKPEFVLFDEAVSALDVSVQAQVLNMIKVLQAEYGFSAIFISHDLAATRYVASRIVVLYAGCIVEDAPADCHYGLAAHPYTQGLQFASGLVADATHELDLGTGTPPAFGCRLHDRCPHATERCRTNEPELTQSGAARVACFLSQPEEHGPWTKMYKSPS